MEQKIKLQHYFKIKSLVKALKKTNSLNQTSSDFILSHLKGSEQANTETKSQNDLNDRMFNKIANDLSGFEKLLNMGADPNCFNDTGDTPLTMIVKFYLSSTISCWDKYFDILMNKKADINLKNQEGYTPLSLACKYKGFNEKVKDYKMDAIENLVVKYKADVNARNLLGETALILSIINPDEDMNTINYLIEAKTDLTLKDFSGKNALDWAVDRQKVQTVLSLFPHYNLTSEKIKDYLDNSYQERIKIVFQTELLRRDTASRKTLTRKNIL